MLEDDADPGLTHHGINILIKRTNYRKIKICGIVRFGWLSLMYFLGHLDFVDEHNVNNIADLLCKVKGFLKNEIVTKMWGKKEKLLLNLVIEKKSSRNLGPWGWQPGLRFSLLCFGFLILINQTPAAGETLWFPFLFGISFWGSFPTSAEMVLLWAFPNTCFLSAWNRLYWWDRLISVDFL